MKKTNRQFFCYKFNSDRLKKFNYDIEIDFNQAKENGEIIAIADNQILRTIRDIKHIEFDKNIIEKLYAEREFIKKQPNSKANIKALKNVQEQINHLLFFPEYVTITIDKPKHYDYLFKNGFKINGEIYKRLSCSAGQARNSTVLFCCETIIDDVKERLNNGRDVTVPIAPSKFNAYFGLYSSATQVVTEPRFVVVPDYNNNVQFEVNYVTETDNEKDDKVDVRQVEQEIDRTDGMGLISPKMAEQWAKDLELDYVPSQFIIRQSFLKGLVTVFDFHEFCKEKNSGNYLVKTVYKDEQGNNIYEDLQNVDVIVSESQFKLWNSYSRLQEYKDNYHKNNIQWAVAQYSPKQYDDVSFLNYQFIQTLNMSEKDIERLCGLFVDWVQGVNLDNLDYALLFLTGQNNTEERIIEYLKSWEIYWIKALIVNRKIYNDKYIKEKIYQYISNIIKRACLGTIPVFGNFQYMITDPYAYMEHVCGLEVKGLLGKNEFYSNYWNKKAVKKVDSMRAPMTYYSEHTVLNLKKTEETEKWYKYTYNGIIVNWFGHEVYKWAGSDFDGDIVLTTSNETMINSIFQNELPVLSESKKPKKIIPTEKDLYTFDKFGMGSIIGQITNKGASAYALLPNLKQKYGENSPEYKVTMSRLQQTCKAQALQIDKTKIGQQVKGIPKRWTVKAEKDDDVMTKEQYNHILLNRRPYFFRYLYKDSRKQYKEYVEKQEIYCIKLFGKPLDTVLHSLSPTTEEQEFIEKYYEWCPLIISDSCMNLLCRYIESIDFNIKDKIKTTGNFTSYELYKNEKVNYTAEQKSLALNALHEYKQLKTIEQINKNSGAIYIDERETNKICSPNLEEICLKYISNIDLIVNIFVDYFYVECPKSNKEILWKFFGKYIFDNILKNTHEPICFPIKDKNGDIEYLGEKYEVKEITV